MIVRLILWYVGAFFSLGGGAAQAQSGCLPPHKNPKNLKKIPLLLKIRSTFFLQIASQFA